MDEASGLLGGSAPGGGTPPATPPATPPTATPPAAAPSGTPTDWRATLPESIREDATLKKYKSVDDLAGAYINAQKLIGGNKMIVPNENTSEDEWKDIFKKLGVPEKVDDYKVKFKDGSTIQEDFVKDFQATAHKLGVLPKQAQALAEWFSDINLGSEAKIKAQAVESLKQTQADLKKEWGNAYQVKINRATKVLMENGGKELVDHFNSMGWGADKKALSFLAGLGDLLYKEDGIVPGGGGDPALTPKEIQGEINKIMGDSKHPYYLKDHPGHKAAVEQVRQMHEQLYSQKK